ncbi:MAG: glycosyltransferase family 2 protein [Phocaeicola sp.]
MTKIKNQPKVSVIVPVYNTAPYLCDAVDSLLSQSLEELEIILVNDGSTDESGTILREYAVKDKRIKLVEQENRGLSEARNAGMPYVTGEYLYYMDSDDVLDTHCLQMCYDCCEASSLDFVCFDARALHADKALGMQNYDRSKIVPANSIYEGQALFQLLISKGGFRPSVWLLFVRFSSLTKHFTGFYPGILHEDHLYSVPLFLHSKRVSYLPHPFFNRRIRPDSIMGKCFTNRNIEGYKITTQELLKLAIDYPQFNAAVNIYLTQMLNAVVWEAHKLPWASKVSLFGWLVRSKLIKKITLRNVAVLWLKSHE